MSNSITMLLDSYNANTLHEMAQAAGLDTTRDGKKLRKKELLAKLEQEYFTEARVLASLGRLSDQERAALDRLMLRGDTVPTRILRRELIRAKLATEAPEPEEKKGHYYSRRSYTRGYVGQPHPAGSTVFEDIIARLTYHGLVFSRGSATNAVGGAYKLKYHPASTLFIPPEIRRFLPDPDPIESKLADWQPARVYTSTPDLFLRDLYLYWDFVRQNEVSLLKSGYIAKRMLKNIDTILLSSDPRLGEARREDDTGHIYLLRQLLEHLKLVRLTQKRLQLTSKEPLDIPDFWGQPVVKQVSRCLEVWPTLTGFKELGKEEATQYGAQFTAARRAVIKALKSLPVGTWLSADELLEQVQIENIDFLLPEHSRVESQQRANYYYSRYSSPSFYGKPADLLKIFERTERDFINACLGDFLYRLGIVELGSSAEAATPSSTEEQLNWDAFKLTPLGRVVLGQSDALPEPPAHSGKLVIQPNFQIMAIGPVVINILARLDLFADREQADRGVFQYRLSKESVYQAQQLGWPVADIIKFLEQVAETDLPQNIHRSLEEWAGHHERIVFRSGVSLLQTANADLLQRLLADSPASPHLARPVAEDVALIKNQRQKPLVKSLIDQALLPAISGADPAAADQSVIIRADGLIEPVHAVPSLHLRGRLTQVATETDRGWQLTATSVGRNGGNRDRVNQLLRELSKLHRGQLPEPLMSQIKTWGGYYGQAAAETLTLIEFNDPLALQELSQDPTLQADLTPFPAGERALAIIPTHRLAEIKDILAGFGVTVQEGLPVDAVAGS